MAQLRGGLVFSLALARRALALSARVGRNEPRDDAEREILLRERKDLGFDPLSSAEQLTASEKGARRDAKRVLAALMGYDPDREDACLEECPLALLRQRGAKTGLAPYLQELEERLVPFFDPSANPTAHRHAR